MSRADRANTDPAAPARPALSGSARVRLTSHRQRAGIDLVGEPRITICHGARATENALLERIDDLLSKAEEDPRALGVPVRVVVPSSALRDHLLATVVRRRGRAAAGLIIETLFGTAREILDRAGRPVPIGDALLEVLGWRHLRRHPAVAGELAGLGDVASSTTATLRDLIDAGLTPAHLPAVDEALAELGDTLVVRRSRALAEVAAALAPILATAGAGNAHLLGCARGLLDDDTLLPSRAVLVHGFAEATGLATDLLEVLLRSNGEIFLDHPPDPAEPGLTDAGAAHTRRLIWRLGGTAEPTGPGPSPPVLELFEAPGADAEIRAVAEQIRSLLDTGALPESITVAARDLAPYRAVLRRHLGRLGVPFSANGETVTGTPVGRRLCALAELLNSGRETATERWIDAWSAAPAGIDLRLGLRSIGAGRLAAVATLDPGAVLVGDALPLPVRTGIDEDGDVGLRLPRRYLQGDRLRDTVAAASRTAALLEAWPDTAPAADHAAYMVRLLALLRWGDDEAGQLARAAAAALERDVPPGIGLDRDEAVRLLRHSLEAAGGAPLGGAGGGVQVLSVMEARGTTAEHLFLLGVNRGSFPRVVLEDPLLPDWIRRKLQVVLPDVPVKATGHDEDRFLFSQLLSAAPRITVSWQSADDDGKAQTPSPLVERLRLAGHRARRVATVWGDGSALRPAWEHAVLAGLSGDRKAFAAMLPAALAEATSPAESAEPRVRILAELDPELASDRLGPYFGFTGPLLASALPVTTIERVAICPWQAFLTKHLRLEVPPDPLEGLPGLDPMLVGTAIHAVVDAVVREGTKDPPADLDTALATPPTAVAWPDRRRLDEILEAVTRGAARNAGVAHLAAPLAARVSRFLPLLRATLWGPDAVAAIFGTEMEGSTEFGPGTTVRFRVDIVEATADGVLLTDLKSGRPPYRQKTEATRRRHLTQDIAAGRRLQIAAYALGAPRASGRYVFVGDPDHDHVGRTLAVTGDEVRAPFVHAVTVALSAWTTGAFLPRLVEASRNAAPKECGHCEVREACLQGDSGARRRLLQWAAGQPPDSGPEAAARAIFDLGRVEVVGEG